MRKIVVYIVKLLLIAITVGLVVAVIFIGLKVASGEPVAFDMDLLGSVGYYIFYSIVLTFINSIYYDYLNHKVTWGRFAKYRLVLSALGGVAVTMLAFFGYGSLSIWGLKERIGKSSLLAKDLFITP